MGTLCPILGRITEVAPTAFSRGHWKIVKCVETGFVFLENPPAYEQLETEYAWEVTSHAEKQRRRSQEPALARVSLMAAGLKMKLFPRRNRFFTLAAEMIRSRPASSPLTFLDIGCGGGDLLDDMHGRFAEIGRTLIPKGIEVSRQLAGIADRRFQELGGNVVLANAVDGSAGFEPESIDVVIMSSFLEHECQPLVLLRKLHSVLSPEGAIVLKVPNFACINRLVRSTRWCGFRFPDHVNYFTPATLQRLAREAGFEITRQRLIDRLPFSDTMYAVLQKQS